MEEEKLIDAAFRSPNDVDIKLDRSGEVIFVTNGGKNNIPGENP